MMGPGGGIHNVGVPGERLQVANGHAVFRNPDTQSMHVLDLSNLGLVDLGHVVAHQNFQPIHGGVLFYVVVEDTFDWNRDGDLLDRIPWVYSLTHRGPSQATPVLAGGRSTSTARGPHFPLRGAVTNVFTGHTDGRFVVYLQTEADQGATDLNGDGDLLDRVWALHDLESGRTRNLRMAGAGPPGVFGEFAFVPAYLGPSGLVTVTVPTDGSPSRRISPHVVFDFRHVPGLGVAGITSDFSEQRVAVFENCAD